jgi:ribosomal-protein-alanine N-acetyltransferase
MNPLADNLQIRRMLAGDVARVMEIAESLPGAPHWPETAYVAAVNPDSAQLRIALILSDSGEILGFAVASLLPPQAELETIGVAAESQRNGLGRRLFGAMMSGLQAAGVIEVLLEVRPSNQAALAFYRSLGFAQTGRRTGYYADPIEDAVLMQLSIG